MRRDAVVRNDLSAEATEWLSDYFDAIDARDVDAFGCFLAEDCALQLNYVGPLPGKAAVLGMLGPYWASLAGVAHEPRLIIGDDHQFAVEGLHHYQTRTGRTHAIPATEWIDRDSAGLAARIRIYCDATPVFAEETA